MKKLLFFWHNLKSTFWFIPVAIIGLSIIMAFELLYLDKIFHYKPEGVFQYIFPGSAGAARSVLSAISGAMITVAGTVFSITLVALTLASSQFGPRLLRNFMHERLNQVVLGTYVSTYVYCLIILNAVRDNDSISFIPTLSVFAAFLATIANIILLIIFIHHIAIQIQADYVISDISGMLSKNIEKLFPEEMTLGEVTEKEPDMPKILDKFDYHMPVLAPKSGYLQFIDPSSLIRKMKEHNQLLILDSRPGKYLVESMTMGMLYSFKPIQPQELIDLQETIVIGQQRSTDQDAEFSILQMVEIAARALSPGVNDPFTAIACIDNLTSTLCRLTLIKFPSKYRYDDEDQLRIVAKSLDFDGLINAAFNQIRQYAAGNPSVLIKLMEALNTLKTFSSREEHQRAVKRHADMVLRISEESMKEINDLNDLKERYVPFEESKH